jgi:hypothetical protein
MTENHVALPTWTKSIFLVQDGKTARKTNSGLVLSLQKNVRQANLNLCNSFDDNLNFCFKCRISRLGILENKLTDETFCYDCTVFICIQVKSASGAWVEAVPIPGTILGIAYWLRKYFSNLFY